MDADNGHLKSDGIAWHARQSGAATVTDVDSLTKNVHVTTSAGFVALSYGAVAAAPVAVDATAAQVQAAINSVTGASTVAVSGNGTESKPWVVAKNPAGVTLGNVGATGATLTSTDTQYNSTYTLAYTAGGNIDLQFGSATETVNVNDSSALQTALETLTGWAATVVADGSNQWSITLALRSVTAATSGVGEATVTEVSALSDQVSVDSGIGVLRVNYGGTLSNPLSFNATGAQVAAAINAMTLANSVAVMGSGTSASPWTIARVADAMTLSNAGTTGATLSADDAENATYTLSYTTAGDVELSFQSKTQTVAVDDRQALRTAVETLTGMAAAVTASGASNTWSISLSLKPLSISATGAGGVVTTFVDSATANQRFAVDANAGIFSLQYGGTATDPLAFNATSEQVQDAINRVTGVGTVDVSGEGTPASPWVITQSTMAMTIDAAGSTGAVLTATNTDNTTYTLSYSAGGTIDLAYDGKTIQAVEVSDSTALKTAIETLTGTSATITSAGATKWSMTLTLKTIVTKSTNVPLVTGISSGLMTVAKPVADPNTGLANVPEVVLGSDDKLLFGSSGSADDDKFTVVLEDQVGQSQVVSTPDAPLQVLIGESLRDDDGNATVNEKHFGGVSLYYIDSSHYLLAVQTELIQPEKEKLETKLASNWTQSAIEVGIDAVKSELGSLTTSQLGNETTSLTASVASTVLTEAIGLWNAVSGITVSTAPTLIIEDLPDTELAYFDAETKTIHLDTTAAGHTWHTGDKNSTVPSSNIDLLTVLVHEIGHGLGLEHTAGEGVMGSELLPGERHISGLGNSITAQQKSEADKLLDGLGALATWSSNLDQYLIDEMLSIDLPFGQLSLSEIVPDGVLPDTDALKDKLTDTANVGQCLFDRCRLAHDRRLAEPFELGPDRRFDRTIGKRLAAVFRGGGRSGILRTTRF